MNPQLWSALKWGGILGGPLAVLETLLVLMALRNNNMADFNAGNCLGTTLEIFLPLVAGTLAGRETGSRLRGLQAGLTVGVIVAVVNMISELLLPPNALTSLTGDTPISGGDLILATLMARVLTVSLGAWGGWLGGRLGQILAAGPPSDSSRP
jgi:hypothetical protein